MCAVQIVNQRNELLCVPVRICFCCVQTDMYSVSWPSQVILVLVCDVWYPSSCVEVRSQTRVVLAVRNVTGRGGMRFAFIWFAVLCVGCVAPPPGIGALRKQILGSCFWNSLWE